MESGLIEYGRFAAAELVPSRAKGQRESVRPTAARRVPMN